MNKSSWQRKRSALTVVMLPSCNSSELSALDSPGTTIERNAQHASLTSREQEDSDDNAEKKGIEPRDVEVLDLDPEVHTAGMANRERRTLRAV